MNAKAPYRKQRKLQAALTRALETLANNVADEIPPDRTTALLAWEILNKLLPFIRMAGLDVAELPGETDLSRFVGLIRARRKEAPVRYRRRRKHLKGTGQVDGGGQ
jgi:predicted metal-dependent peptidase